MLITCPICGTTIVVNNLGRKRLNIPVKIVCDRLRGDSSVGSVAESLGCSKPYIFKVLKDNGLKLKDIREGNYGKQATGAIKKPAKGRRVKGQRASIKS